MAAEGTSMFACLFAASCNSFLQRLADTSCTGAVLLSTYAVADMFVGIRVIVGRMSA